jgi:hypothetical protein
MAINVVVCRHRIIYNPGIEVRYFHFVMERGSGSGTHLHPVAGDEDEIWVELLDSAIHQPV